MLRWMKDPLSTLSCDAQHLWGEEQGELTQASLFHSLLIERTKQLLMEHQQFSELWTLGSYSVKSRSMGMMWPTLDKVSITHI